VQIERKATHTHTHTHNNGNSNRYISIAAHRCYAQASMHALHTTTDAHSPFAGGVTNTKTHTSTERTNSMHTNGVSSPGNQ
jgi:hypothetical protein